MASTAKSGKLVLLKIETDTPGTFEPVLSARNNSFSINHTTVDVTTKLDDGWTAILSGGGVTTLETSVSGVFLNTPYDKKLRSHGVTGEQFEAEIVVGNGDKFAGTFIATKMTIGGEYNGAESYDLSLQNVGAITYTPAP